MAKILNIIGTAVIVFVIVLCLSLVLPKVFGISSYAVLTGSMEPSIPVGSVVYSKATDPEFLSKGDVIVFYDGRNEIPVTHRVVENQTSENQVITKGDANDSNDITPIIYPNIIGKVFLHIPVLGRLLMPFGTFVGKIAAFMIVIAGFLLCEVARRLKD